MRTLTKKYVSDIFGVMYYNYYLNRREIYYNIRREDDYIDYGNEISRYFQTYNDWSEVSRDVLQDVVGRILDFGAGAGRHALFFQEKGHEVVALDNSRFAMKVMKKMGVKKIVLGDVNFLEKLNFSQGSFDTILMMFNNFGLGGSQFAVKKYFSYLHHITSKNAKIINVGINPYLSDDPAHIRYNNFLMQNKCSGCINLRVEYKDVYGSWYYLYMTDPTGMEKVLNKTGWKVDRFSMPENIKYGAVISKL